MCFDLRLRTAGRGFRRLQAVWRFSRNKEECYQISIFIICATLQLPNYAIMIDYDVFENYSKSFSLKDSNDTFWVNFKH